MAAAIFSPTFDFDFVLLHRLRVRGRTGKNKIWPPSRLGDVVVVGDKLNNVPTWHGHGSSHPGFYFMDISVPSASPAVICQFTVFPESY